MEKIGNKISHKNPEVYFYKGNRNTEFSPETGRYTIKFWKPQKRTKYKLLTMSQQYAKTNRYKPLNKLSKLVTILKKEFKKFS